MVSIAHKKKLAQKESERTLIENSQVSHFLEDDNEGLHHLSKGDLIKKIKSLQEKLCEEKERKQLRESKFVLY